MRVIGVIDLRHGRAVHARGGVRAAYRSVECVQGLPIAGDPVALARVYVERLGIDEIYVADLDAILDDAIRGDASSEDGVQWSAIASIAAIGAPVAVDAGTRSLERARALRAHGVSRVIVGLETLDSFEALRDLCDGFGPGIALSLDLRARVPLLTPTMAGRTWTIEVLAAESVRCGVTSLIVLDLARVGLDAGPDVEICRRLRPVVPGVPLLSGGGVRDRADLEALRDAGCDGVLVATALHRGALPDYVLPG